ncbi:TonB-dependent receptor [Novosphingobium sp.]|uniref:TonB-dependent receptor n=1 Tax=Novosphingobium sp. TaxID=1874826 RepID=UPI0025D8455E|nr:TonB-dependent receptor [Novosphingobium sp.]
MKSNIRLGLACSTAALALSCASLAHAQTATAPSAAEDDTSGQEIVVTGLRASLERAQTLKQDSASVVEALSAEDIGKLPQSSVADSLGRLAGLAGERRSGRVSGISVRGFREDFVGTTLNGRELIGIGDNRGVEYDLYPSEIIDSAVVYKTPNAELSAVGIGGTVDLRTIHPLEHKRSLVVNGSFELNGQKSKNPDFKDKGYRAALSFSDRFANDTIGVALTAATTSSPTQDNFFSVWGYDKGAITSGPDAGKYAPAGIDISSRSRVLKRDTLAGVIEFKPSSNFTARFDGLYINFSDKGVSRGFIEALGIPSNGSTVLTSTATAITSARTSGFNSVLRTDPLDKTGKLTVFGGNFEYDAGANVKFLLDVSHAKSSKRDTRAESYSGLGRAATSTQGPNNIQTYTYTPNGLVFSNNSQLFDDFNKVKLAGPQSWGGGLAPLGNAPGTPLYVSATSPVGFAQAQDGFVNTGIFDEKLDSARFEVKANLDNGFIKTVNAGVRYSNHKKSKINQGFFLTAPTYPLDGPIPTDAQRGLADLNWVGLGNVVAYDALSLINGGYYKKWDAGLYEPDRLADTYTISETVWQPFIEGEFESELSGGARIFGNAGVQAVITKQRGTGFNSAIQSNLVALGVPITDGASYTRILPSVNINFDLTGGHTIRLSAAKVISRPRIDFLNPGSKINFRNNVANVTNPDPALGPWVSSSGNATLRPYEANQVDLSYEWYFARDGFVSATVFYKKLVNWNVAATSIRDFTAFYIPGYHQAVSSDGLTKYTPATFKGVNTSYTGGLKGDVKGLEVQAALPFGRFVGALDGFGIIAGGAFTDGKLDDGSAIPGLSKSVLTGTVYFEKAGFSARVSANKRSAWLSEDRGGSNSISPVNRAGETLVDAQIGYDFKDSGLGALSGLRLSLQAQNLTNQKDIYVDSASGLISRSETYGRNFLFNATFSFF